MRLASFAWAGSDRIGFEFDDETILDLAAVASLMGVPAPADMISLIESGASGEALLAKALRFAREHPLDVNAIPQSDITWHPPVRRPAKICGVAMNNSGSNARKITVPDHPLFFLKPSSCLVGHGAPIEVHPYYGSVHPEPELAVIIGKRCRYVPVEEAMSVVYGYSIMDDVTGNGMRAEDMVHYYALYRAEGSTSNELERREQHLSYAARYKGTDTFGPMGPWLVTKGDIADPHVLDVSCWHNDDLIAEDSTRYYTYSVPEIIAFITRFHSLWPGDVISMGTAFRPGKVGGKALHAANLTSLGGTVTITIAGIGTLVNPVRILG
ncbi:MAG: fumarylacetoacetate hydrolase family protein [Gammaproteobacteria bacterium]